MIARWLATLLGLAGIAAAILLDQPWWDRHFLPFFDVPHPLYVDGERAVRIVFAIIGVLCLVVLRPRVGRATAGDVVRVGLAVVLALGCGELILRQIFQRAVDEPPPNVEPLRVSDPRLGWVFAPGHLGRDQGVAYVFDMDGDRVAAFDRPVDPDRPTLLFTGESIMAGYGLAWDDSIPAQVGTRLGIQSANLAVFGYSTAQAYLRLAVALPRFTQPVALVSLFTPSLFDRNFRDDRPHLDKALDWLPAVRRWRLAALVKWLVPYRSDAAIEDEIATTVAVLRATSDLAQSRGAKSLIVVPQFGPETPMEATLRRRILDEPGLAYVEVPLDPAWHLPGDVHPDARADRVIAAAVSDRLSGEDGGTRTRTP